MIIYFIMSIHQNLQMEGKGNLVNLMLGKKKVVIIESVKVEMKIEEVKRKKEGYVSLS